MDSGPYGLEAMAMKTKPMKESFSGAASST